MVVPSANTIKQLYEHNDYHYYPKMENVIDSALAEPEKKIEIPDDFISNKLESSGLILDTVRKIKFFFQSVFIKTRCLLSPSYCKKYESIINKIGEAYSEKIAAIAKLSNAIMMKKEPISDGKQLVSVLNSRVQELKESIKTDEERLQEKIDTKNLIIQQAKALKAKREYVPTTGEKVLNYLASFNPFGTYQEAEPEVTKIKSQDDSFPIDNLSPQKIADYENEEYTESKLIKEIKALRIDVEGKRKLVKNNEDRLEAVRLILKKTNMDITKAVQEIKDLHLENFFGDEDFIIPDIAEEKVAVTKELSPQEIQLQIINQEIASKTASKDLANLFETLIKRLPENAITSWKCDDKGNFTLKAKEPYYVWMPEKNLVGGVVIMLGYQKDGEIQGKLGKGEILFSSGVNGYIKVPLFGYITPTIDGLKFNSRIDVQIGGTYAGQTLWRKKIFSALKEDWGSKAVVIDPSYKGGYQKFLEEQVAKT